MSRLHVRFGCDSRLGKGMPQMRCYPASARPSASEGLVFPNALQVACFQNMREAVVNQQIDTTSMSVNKAPKKKVARDKVVSSHEDPTFKKQHFDSDIQM